MTRSDRASPPRSRLSPRAAVALAASALVLAFGAGVATSVLAQGSARTYSTKGKVISVTGDKLVIKDKFGVDWEYELTKGLSTTIGKAVKVVYTMRAAKIEAH